MLTSTRRANQRLQNASANARTASEEEPSCKKVRLDVPPNSPASSPIKGPLELSAEKNSSFIAKCFYGLKKSQLARENVPAASEDKSSGCNKSSVTKFITGKAMCPRIQLDQLMMERIAKSPVKQAVLQTCSLLEFRQMYRDEYKQLEEEILMMNCRQTRQTYQTIAKIKKEKLENYLSSDSGDDEISFRFNELNQHCKNDQDKPEKRELVVKCNQQREAQKMLVKELRQYNESTPKKTEYARPNVKESNERGPVYKKPWSKKSENVDQISPLPNSGRKFFKTRSPSNNLTKANVLLGRGFSFSFTMKTKSDKKKRKSESVRHKRKLVPETSKTMSRILVTKENESTASGEQLSAVSGFTFAPGFLVDESTSEKSTNGKPQEEKEESLDLNKSNCRTYGSLLPKHTLADCDSSDGLSEDASNVSGHSQNNSVEDNEYKNSALSQCGSSQPEEESQSSTHNKLFPIFDQKRAKSALFNKSPRSKNSNNSLIQWSRKLHKVSSNSQMIIDAGQKKFGAVQCPVCSMVYCHADPGDETAHAKFHKRLLEVLKFPGWKKERVVQEYPEDLGRVLLVMHDDTKYVRKKVEEINEVMGRELGFPENSAALSHPYYKVFLYVEDKHITGCCVAEPVTEGYRVIPGDMDDSEVSGQRPWRCASVSEPVCVGISRLWVVPEKRQSGVATKLIDCVRQWFNYGSLIPKHKVAFSDPTSDGRKFAQKYIGAPTFLVYKYNQS